MFTFKSVLIRDEYEELLKLRPFAMNVPTKVEHCVKSLAKKIPSMPSRIRKCFVFLRESLQNDNLLGNRKKLVQKRGEHISKNRCLSTRRVKTNEKRVYCSSANLLF